MCCKKDLLQIGLKKDFLQIDVKRKIYIFFYYKKNDR